MSPIGCGDGGGDGLQRGRGGIAQCARIADERRQQVLYRFRHGCRPCQTWRRVAVARHIEFDPPAALARGRGEGTLAAPAQGGQHALDVLAGAQAVDPMIRAAAGVEPFGEAADLDVVTAAGGGTDAEAAEIGLRRFACLDAEDLGLAAPTAALDFLLVVGEPALQRRRAVEHALGAR